MRNEELMVAEESTFAEALERLRISRGLTPAELARALGEYEGNVSRWRRGGGIDVVKVRKVADYFAVDRAWLEGLAGYPPSTPADPIQIQSELEARLTRLGTTLSRYPRTVWLAVVEANERMADALAHQSEPPVSAPRSDRVSASGRTQTRVNLRRKPRLPDAQHRPEVLAAFA